MHFETSVPTIAPFLFPFILTHYQSCTVQRLFSLETVERDARGFSFIDQLILSGCGRYWKQLLHCLFEWEAADSWLSLTFPSNVHSVVCYSCLVLFYTCIEKKIIPMWTDEFLCLFHPIPPFRIFLLHYSFSLSPPLFLSCRWYSSTCSGLPDGSHSNLFKTVPCANSIIYTVYKLHPISLCLCHKHCKTMGAVCVQHKSTYKCAHSLSKQIIVLELGPRGINVSL